jgi:hypothetical protein
MHLFFENIGPNMYRFWSDKFYKKNDQKKAYSISKNDWQEIGRILEQNKYNMPTSMGRVPRNIYKHSTGYKAKEWSNWIMFFSLPLLKGRIEERYEV